MPELNHVSVRLQTDLLVIGDSIVTDRQHCHHFGRVESDGPLDGGLTCIVLSVTKRAQ